MRSDFDLVEGYRNFLARWLWVLAAGLLGACVGLAVSYVRPPSYEASAVIGIVIDRNRADVPDDITVRQAYDRVRALLLADDTLDAALALGGQAPAAGTESQARAAFRDRLRLVEKPDGWELVVLGTDSREVERLAQAWADVSLDQIKRASLHAIRAADWQHVMYEASCRLGPGATAADPARFLCKSAPPAGGADTLPASILAEVEASRGILPVLVYSALRGSSGTAWPVLWGKGSLVLGGAVVGLVLGTVLAMTRKRPTSA
jgi:hypothetical protein